MKEEILSCIRKKIDDDKKKEYEKLKEDRNKELVEESVRKSLLEIIEKFFDGLPRGKSYRINLSEPNDSENPREVSRTPGAITYPCYIHLKPNLKDIGYDVLDITMPPYGKLIIDGFNIMFGRDYHNIDWQFDAYGRRNTKHTSWKLKQLQAFVKELDWFEEQIAKQYGCSK